MTEIGTETESSRRRIALQTLVRVAESEGEEGETRFPKRRLLPIQSARQKSKAKRVAVMDKADGRKQLWKKQPVKNRRSKA